MRLHPTDTPPLHHPATALLRLIMPTHFCSHLSLAHRCSLPHVRGKGRAKGEERSGDGEIKLLSEGPYHHPLILKTVGDSVTNGE
jgi:hypothetical protein